MITDIISLVLIFIGSFFVFSAAVGLVRFNDTMSRIHSITKPQTVGLILTVLGAIIRVTGSESFSVAERGDLGILILLVVFALITSPVTGQRLGRIARREGLYGSPETMSRNEAPASRGVKRR
ncbi:monovalent cation/H+ antiporter subunit G [Corynebacterium kutscheri]|uniref:Monovalent cation/H+ antiporter subunit G n=1 Tax=Corynebacterium kutscheri TaxID=35755 RepID=A0A0F6R0Y8_9CORY|nr:monovalent cation/H(+) antiporter subunit G [Corynebacterium kutscheri]AKE41997.1 multisubunit Na+/H+ antiporter, MnhG subunit [Corynebacterium kutscheri]VEH06197.1 monovalent cation/H+ antiporter subunit G [Corynebacterium kutscheri]VEH10338.1 monovalent cation/H+ antiporter subunit G [Corynebacterium kutscheri]VEH82112.1 monovalent cation/H+ antiporter subunit G [Corynebacterium kutscheri]